jgi:hypothetical protein
LFIQRNKGKGVKRAVPGRPLLKDGVEGRPAPEYLRGEGFSGLPVEKPQGKYRGCSPDKEGWAFLPTEHRVRAGYRAGGGSDPEGQFPGKALFTRSYHLKGKKGKRPRFMKGKEEFRCGPPAGFYHPGFHPYSFQGNRRGKGRGLYDQFRREGMIRQDGKGPVRWGLGPGGCFHPYPQGHDLFYPQGIYPRFLPLFREQRPWTK